jgi:excisionase family DNA binding protein
MKRVLNWRPLAQPLIIGFERIEAMSRSKRAKPSNSTQAKSSTGRNGPLAEVLTLAEAAAYLRLGEAEVLRLIDEQGLPVRQIGSERRFLKAAIQRWLSTGTSRESAKAAQLAVAGAWKEDPLVDEELREIYRRRGHAAAEEEA